MFKILTKLFIKNKDNISDQKVRTAYGALCGVVGIVSNLFIAAIKIIAGLIANSIAIMADGINSLTDGGASVITLFAFRFSNKAADSEHPFGHERLEYISGLFVSIIILIIGGFLAESSISKIINPVPIDTSSFYIILAILIASIFIKVWQFMFYRKAGKTINSTSLVASSFDSLSDVLTTSTVLISLIVARLYEVMIDGYMGLAVSLFIIYSGIKLIKETVSPLLGEAPSEEYVAMIKEKLNSYDNILGYHDLMIHSYGPAKNFITVHMEVDSNIDVMKSHDIIDMIEQDFLNEYNVNLVVHLDPVDTSDEATLKLKNEINLILKTIDEVISFHDFRIVKGKRQTKVLFDVVVPDKFYIKDKDLIEKITEKIQLINVNYIPYIVVDHHYLG